MVAGGRRLHPRVLVLVLAFLLRLLVLQGDLEGVGVLPGLPRPQVQHHRLALDEAALQDLLQRLRGRVRRAGLDLVLLLQDGTVSLVRESHQ